MFFKLKIIFEFYKKFILTLILITIVPLIYKEDTPLLFFFFIKLFVFLVLKLWWSFMDIIYKEKFIFYQNLGIHSNVLFIVAFIFDIILTPFIFYGFKHILRWF